MAIAISADDVAPEVAENCFGNLGPVDENDESDDESGDEIPEEKNPNPSEKVASSNLGNGSSIQSQQTAQTSTGTTAISSQLIFKNILAVITYQSSFTKIIFTQIVHVD